MSQLPYGPDDLASPPLSGNEFLELLDSDFARKTAERPLVFERITDGSLSLDYLRVWAQDLYLYWDSLYFSTGAVFVKTNETKTREGLLRKLVEVEGRVLVNDVSPDWTNRAYEEMWLDFCEAIGLGRSEVTSFQTFTRSFFAISTLCLYARGWEWSWLDGVANLYAADLYYIEFLSGVLESLRTNYKLPEDPLRVFEAVIADAKENVSFEREALAYWACTTERQLTAARAFRERIDIENQIAESMAELIVTSEMPFQVPEGAQVPALLDRV